MTPGETPSSHPQELLAELLSSLGYLVLLPLDDGGFRSPFRPPGWQEELPSPIVGGADVSSLAGDFPFLENFLIDAQLHWEEGSREPLISGPWIEVTRAGDELALNATALLLEHGPALLIRAEGEAYAGTVDVLQVARENILNSELLERLVEERTVTIRQREEELAIRLVAAAEFRDEDTGKHVRRIGVLSQLLAEALGCQRHFVQDIRLAAAMHDLGKIAIPDEILLKPGKLTPEEWDLMRQHPHWGAEILAGSDIPLLLMAGEIALYHHERWDGEGYPQRLVGSSIPLSARIVAVVDTYDALLSDRVYHDAWPPSAVLEHLEKEKGKHFDPEIVDVFIEIQSEVPRILREAEREEGWVD